MCRGRRADKIGCIGNIMLDSFEMLRAKITAAATRERLGLSAAAHAVVTLHRPSNGDRRATLSALVASLVTLAQQIDVDFAIHLCTRKELEDFALTRLLEAELRAGIILKTFLNHRSGAELPPS